MKNNRNNIKQSLKLKKEKRKKAMNCMLKGKDTIIHLTTGQIKKAKYNLVNIFLIQNLWKQM